MGFNKRFVPELEDLKRRRISLGDNMFFKIYITSPDTVIGSIESIDYIDTFAREHRSLLDSKNKQK